MPTLCRARLLVLAFLLLVPSRHLLADPQVWQIGTNNPSGGGTGEFSAQNGVNDAPPGSSTALDDDYYTAGTYPAGFNGLASTLTVAANEPWLNWESALTLGDKTNRIHLNLTSAQVTPSSWFRLSFEFASANGTSNGVSLGFGDHDILVQFKNAAGTPTVIFGGEEYGTGSSRDWAAKGTQLLGIKAVVARSFERIHRSNLVGMGVLPLQFKAGESWETLGLKGDETVDVIPAADLRPQSDATLVITRADGQRREVTITLRIDTPIEVDYYRHGGILPFVLRQLLAA